MTVTNEQIQTLKAAAEKATPGRIGDRIDGSGSIKYECVGYDGSLVLKTDHKNMEYGFVGDNADADELFFRLCVPDFILSLLAERAADKKQLEQLVADRMSLLKTMGVYVHAYEEAKSHIAELESRTLTVKLPRDITHVTNKYFEDGRDAVIEAIESQLAAAGITLDVGE